MTERRGLVPVVEEGTSYKVAKEMLQENGEYISRLRKELDSSNKHLTTYIDCVRFGNGKTPEGETSAKVVATVYRLLERASEDQGQMLPVVNERICINAMKELSRQQGLLNFPAISDAIYKRIEGKLTEDNPRIARYLSETKKKHGLRAFLAGAGLYTMIEEQAETDKGKTYGN